MRHLLLGSLAASGLLAPSGAAQRTPEIRAAVALDLPGRTATEIDAGVLASLRDRLDDVQGVTGVDSYSEHGRGELCCRIALRRTDPELRGVLDRIGDACRAADLPAEPQLALQGDPLCTIVVDGDAPAVALRERADAMRAQLIRVAGVTGVHLRGYPEPSTAIELDASALGAAGMTPEGVVATLREVDVGRTQPGDLGRIVLAPSVRLEDLARIRIDATQPSQAAFRRGRQTGFLVVEGPREDLEARTSVREALARLERDGAAIQVFDEPPTHVVEWRAKDSADPLRASLLTLEQRLTELEPRQLLCKIAGPGRGRMELWFDEGRPQLFAALRSAAEDLPGLAVRPFEQARTITLQVLASDHEIARAAARDLEESLAEIQGVRSVLADLAPDERVIRVEPDPERLAARGVTAESFDLQIELLRRGTVLGRRGDQDVVIRLDPNGKDWFDAAVLSASCALVPLSELAEVRAVSEPPSIRRWGGRCCVEVRVDIGGSGSPDRAAILRTCGERLSGRFDAEVR